MEQEKRYRFMEKLIRKNNGGGSPFPMTNVENCYIVVVDGQFWQVGQGMGTSEEFHH